MFGRTCGVAQHALGGIDGDHAIGNGGEGNGRLSRSAAYVECAAEAMDAGKGAQPVRDLIVEERAHLGVSRGDFSTGEVVRKSSSGVERP